MLPSEDLELEIGDTHPSLRDIRRKACEFGEGLVAVIVHSAQRRKESQDSERTVQLEAEQQR